MQRLRGCPDTRYLTVQSPQSNRSRVNQTSSGLGTVGLWDKIKESRGPGRPSPVCPAVVHFSREGFDEHDQSLSAHQCQISTGMLIYNRDLLCKTTVLCCWHLSSATGRADGEGEGSQRLSAGNRNGQTLVPGAS